MDNIRMPLFSESTIMLWTLVKAGNAAEIIVTVSDLSQRMSCIGALQLTLPLVSILAFVMG